MNSRAGYLLVQACQDAVFSFPFPSLLVVLFFISVLLLFSPADEGRGDLLSQAWAHTQAGSALAHMGLRHLHTCTGLFSSEMPSNSVPCLYTPESINKVQCTCRSKLSSLKSHCTHTSSVDSPKSLGTTERYLNLHGRSPIMSS